MGILDKAYTFAYAAHAAVGQKRKYTGADYIVHPVAVESIVHRHGGTIEMRAAALLHDTVEDTDVTIEHINAMFGAEIAEIVGWLTDVSKGKDGTREERKAMDRQHTADAPFEAQFNKCADLIDNTKDIVGFDENFAKVYMREKELLLNAMTKVHNTPIWNEAWDRVVKYYTEDKEKQIITIKG